MRSILPLAEATDPRCGGKARGLAALIAAGFPVPEGFAALPEAAHAAILEAFRRLGSTRVAVRSSAPEEDSAGLSYAGQFATVLNVGEEDLSGAVEACRASGGGAGLAAYRAEPAAPAPIGVVIQRMLAPEYAGAVFASADGELLVEGVEGTGDTLVSGHAAPAALPADLRAAVEALAGDVVTRLGGPQDIEWAAEDGRIWLLQARPLTVPLPAALPDRFRLWTGANVQEAAPRPLTPFSEERLEQGIKEVLAFTFATGGLPATDGPLVRIVRGRFYLSYSALASSMSAVPGFRINDIMKMYGDPPELGRVVAYRPGEPSAYRRALPRTLAGMGGWILRYRSRFHKAQRMAGRDESEIDAALRGTPDGPQLLQLFRASLASAAVGLKPMAFSTMLATTFLIRLMEAGASLAPRVPASSLAALARAGEMASLEPSRQLAALGRWLAAHSGCGDESPEVRAQVDRFIAACGFRGDNEGELAEPRWGERREDVLRMARALSNAPPETAPGATGVPAWLRVVLAPLSASARRWQRRREEARSLLVRGSVGQRRLLLAIGAHARERGELDAAEDVFYLLREEVEALLAGGAPADLRARIARRRALHRRMLGWPQPPRLLAELEDGRVAAYEPDPGGGDAWQGFGASPGRASGRACVLRDPREAGEFKPGDVLVARTTDIGWTPLFRIAAAMVTEIGAPTSHAAIVARELGLPAVVNLPGAATRIGNGDRVFVDGWSGVVRVQRAAARASEQKRS
jgi:pyruvate,water dikinase